MQRALRIAADDVGESGFRLAEFGKARRPRQLQRAGQRRRALAGVDQQHPPGILRHGAGQRQRRRLGTRRLVGPSDQHPAACGPVLLLSGIARHDPGQRFARLPVEAAVAGAQQARLASGPQRFAARNFRDHCSAGLWWGVVAVRDNHAREKTLTPARSIPHIRQKGTENPSLFSADISNTGASYSGNSLGHCSSGIPGSRSCRRNIRHTAAEPPQTAPTSRANGDAGGDATHDGARANGPDAAPRR